MRQIAVWSVQLCCPLQLTACNVTCVSNCRSFSLGVLGLAWALVNPATIRRREDCRIKHAGIGCPERVLDFGECRALSTKGCWLLRGQSDALMLWECSVFSSSWRCTWRYCTCRNLTTSQALWLSVRKSYKHAFSNKKTSCSPTFGSNEGRIT